MIPAITNAIILIIISAIHFYWAMGGRWAADRVFPKIKSTKPIRPSKLATVLAAFIFFEFALMFLDKVQFFEISFPSFVEQYGTWVLGGIFIVRAFGEFKYVGFFKTIKDSKFAEMDTKYYSPLCLFLGFNSLIINYL
jgi:hypothetical protein